MAKYTDARYPEKINDLVDNNGNVNIQVEGGYPIEINFADLLDTENSEAKDILAGYLQEIETDGAIIFIKLATQDKAILEGYYYVQDSEETTFKWFVSFNNKYYFIPISARIDEETGSRIVTIGEIEEIEWWKA